MHHHITGLPIVSGSYRGAPWIGLSVEVTSFDDATVADLDETPASLAPPESLEYGDRIVAPIVRPCTIWISRIAPVGVEVVCDSGFPGGNVCCRVKEEQCRCEYRQKPTTQWCIHGLDGRLVFSLGNNGKRKANRTHRLKLNPHQNVLIRRRVRAGAILLSLLNSVFRVPTSSVGLSLPDPECGRGVAIVFDSRSPEVVPYGPDKPFRVIRNTAPPKVFQTSVILNV